MSHEGFHDGSRTAANTDPRPLVLTPQIIGDFLRGLESGSPSSAHFDILDTLIDELRDCLSLSPALTSQEASSLTRRRELADALNSLRSLRNGEWIFRGPYADSPDFRPRIDELSDRDRADIAEALLRSSAAHLIDVNEAEVSGYKVWGVTGTPLGSLRERLSESQLVFGMLGKEALHAISSVNWYHGDHLCYALNLPRNHRPAADIMEVFCVGGQHASEILDLEELPHSADEPEFVEVQSAHYLFMSEALFVYPMMRGKRPPHEDNGTCFMFPPFEVPYEALRISKRTVTMKFEKTVPSDIKVTGRSRKNVPSRDSSVSDYPFVTYGQGTALVFHSSTLPDDLQLLTLCISSSAAADSVLQCFQGLVHIEPYVDDRREGHEPEAIGALERLIGLKDVKASVRSLVNLMRIQQMRRREGLSVADLSNHLVFTGNPGTGKTTVARVIAGIYRDIGVLESGHLVETDRSGLVAGYVGQTAIKTREVFESARGGILFIDEAYSLARSESTNDYGSEAVDTLMKLMEDSRDDTAVIIAGYPDEMEKLLASNPGMRSRFGRTIHFPDYTADELVQIFILLCDQHDYKVSAEGVDMISQIFRETPRAKGFGNGRLSRNLFENAVSRQANRLATAATPVSREDLLKFLPVDVAP
jgi:Holliday junction resolvasome RuvABC ATP-dependent DNA helicase subunit